MPDTKSIKREAALFDFFNELEADSSPRVASFRYYKTNGTHGEKLHCSRSYETVTMAVQTPRPARVSDETDRHTTINLQLNNLIRIVYSDSVGNRVVRHLKIKLITHYKPSFSKEWMEIRHPEKPVLTTSAIGNQPSAAKAVRRTADSRKPKADRSKQ